MVACNNSSWYIMGKETIDWTDKAKVKKKIRDAKNKKKSLSFEEFEEVGS